jgi:hypothetical protein
VCKKTGPKLLVIKVNLILIIYTYFSHMCQ